MERKSSLSEKPRIQRPRRLADWLNPAGERKVHSLMVINSFLEDAPKAHLCESPVRENRTLGLSGGRRLALVRGASSDQTPTLRRWEGLNVKEDENFEQFVG